MARSLCCFIEDIRGLGVSSYSIEQSLSGGGLGGLRSSGCPGEDGGEGRDREV